ncbi:helix-turn-helix domain-containing protein [Halorussus caseinilyticus]|uniref:Helix-turn-helix domain-containing protein n=2 Tax=Halorussus caseinilyticus TaxID=3034025 RepID=A0ABD5WLY2_9EURY
MRQFEGIETARGLGYYDVPREAELSEVAAELDCTESTASALLRKAERAPVDAALVR